MKIVKQKVLDIYVTSDGEQPFVNWLESLKNNNDRYRIKKRLDRVVLGNLGDYKYISDGVYELRANFGSGYRIYYGKENEKIKKGLPETTEQTQ